MIRIASFAFAAAMLSVSAPAQACQYSCGQPIYPAPVVYPAPIVEYKPVPLPPHYIIEHGPVYDGLGVLAPVRLYMPRMATFPPRYIYGYGVGWSGGPIAVRGYPYVKRTHYRRAAPPLRVYY